jgi:hypothetical protein
MPPRSRKPNEIARQVMPLMLLGIGLVASNANFTIAEDETSSLGVAAQPVRETLGMVWSGNGHIGHPPLYDILFHFWLRLTGGAFESLRVPSILFFLAGLFLLARAARSLGGPASAQAVVWFGALWPLGFHYGRLTASYAFSFFLVAGLTLAYLRYLEDQCSGRWAWLFLFAVAFLWTNYFGWAILGCLAMDQFLRRRAAEGSASPAILVRTGALLCVAFVPLFQAFRGALISGSNFHQRPLAVLANAAFSVYSLFVSESVAPWYWFLSIPAILVILACAGLVATSTPRNARRFLLYCALLIAVMAVSGTLLTRRLLLISPWLLLPVGVAVGTNKSFQIRIGLPVALLMIGGIGWFGIYSRHYYSEPRFLEPWPQVAEDTARKIQSGATLIANNPSFFFYLTYILHAPDGATPWKFVGLLPDQVRHARVKSPEEWLAAGHPVGPRMIWVRGMSSPQTDRAMDEAAHELGGACGTQTSRLMMRDPGYEWKQRLFPDMSALQWRVEVREYDCTPLGSPEIFQIPPR